MRTLIIDANYLAHRALHTTGDLEFQDIKVGIIYGFLRQIKSIGFKFKTNKFLFCWDSRESKRKKLYRAYKANRNNDDNLDEVEKKELKRRRTEAFQQFTNLRKNLLPGIGFKNNYIQAGYEADDLIAEIVRRRKGEFIIVTADQDLYQLLSYASIYKPQTKKLYTFEDFKNEFNLHPAKWSQVKAIAGCHSDNIQGTTGVGDKTAAKYLNGTLKEHTKTYKNIEASERQTKRNLSLTKVPLQGTKLFKIKNDNFDLGYFYNICTRYGMDSLAKDAKNWNKLFKGEFK